MEFIVTLAMKFWQWTILIAVVIIGAIINFTDKKVKTKLNFLVGTMIELPRAALKAKDIAKHAEFFSFGTNDLTQTTFGISRDDSGKFLNDYIENKIFEVDPFISIDEGVGNLIEIASFEILSFLPLPLDLPYIR